MKARQENTDSRKSNKELLRQVEVQQRRIAELENFQADRQREKDIVGMSEEELKGIFDTTKDCIYIQKPDGSFVDVNKAGCDMLGYEKEELLKMGVSDVVPPELAGRLPETSPRRLAEKGVYFESVNVRKDGTRIPVEIGNLLVKFGRERRVIAIVRDISERKRAEEQMRKYQYRLERMIRDRTAQLIKVNDKLLGEIGKRKKVQDELRELRRLLEKHKKAVEQKNSAVREILEQIEIEKKQIKDDVVANIENLLLPLLHRLRVAVSSGREKYIYLLQRELEKLASSFGRKITEENLKLTPREIEICSMIKNGFTSKEIAELLHISIQTTERHRNNTRKKLGIANTKVNLASYLQTL